MNAGRVSQILYTFKVKSAGVNSIITSLLTVAGNLARIFTLFVEVDDALPLIINVSAVCVNFVVLLQILFYGQGEKVKDEGIDDKVGEKEKKWWKTSKIRMERNFGRIERSRQLYFLEIKYEEMFWGK